ncbi:MAG: hypothetical protein Q7U47_15135 [Paludibacter sp.]|nr:hypothetical protein [Paludibacter sp.]
MNIEDLIKKSLQELQVIGSEATKTQSNQKSKLIFPKYQCGKHQNEKRVSEQEARLLFIRELELKNHMNIFYSIETPTKKSYKFSSKEEKDSYPDIVSVEKGGQSASFDLTIYNDQLQRIHFIEFKNGNVDTIKKDFLKLLCDEDNKENYFVNIIEREDLKNRNTLASIERKYCDAVNYIIEKSKNNTDCKINSTLKIILFNINDGDFRRYRNINAQNTNIEVEEHGNLKSNKL